MFIHLAGDLLAYTLKVSKGKLSTCGHRSRRPSLPPKNAPDSFFRCVGLSTPPHNKPVTFPALLVLIYTPGSREVIMVKLRTQHIDPYRAQTHNFLSMNPVLICKTKHAHTLLDILITYLKIYTFSPMGNWLLSRVYISSCLVTDIWFLLLAT